VRKSRLLVAGGLLVAGAAMTVAPTTAGAKTGPTLLRDVRASVADIPLKGVTYPIDGTHPQPDTEIEPSIAVNPGNPYNAVADFQEDRVDGGGDAGNGWATTTDGGKTWHHGYLPGLTRYTGGTFDRASDAVVTFGADPAQRGHYLVYAQSLVFNDGSGPSGDANQSGMAINISHDNGLHWGKAVILEQDGLAGLNDKNWLVADNGTGTGHTTGRVYVVWDRITPMVYTYCDHNCDQLSNWANATTNNGTFYVYNGQPGIGSIPLVEPDGSLAVIFEGDFGGPPGIQNPPSDQPDMTVGGSQLQISLAKGAGAVPWPAPLTFTPISTGIAANNGTAVAEQRAGTLPAAAVDLKTGRIFLAWEDGRFRKDGLDDMVFSTSTDSITWTPPARVNHDKVDSHIDHWNAMVDVANGVVHIGWQQRNEAKGSPSAKSASGLSPFIDTYYENSANNGATWSPALKVSKLTSDVGYAAYSRGGAFLGDYNQLAVASNGWVYLVHNVAMAKYKGEPCNCSFHTGNGHQHQYTYVAVIQSKR
jgi:hypothetical protein